MTWEGLVTQELAEGVGMPTPEGLPQGDHSLQYPSRGWGSRGKGRGFRREASSNPDPSEKGLFAGMDGL